MSDPALSVKQLRSVREAIGRVNLWDGAVRSGKTIGSLLRWLIYVADAPTTGELVVVARTREAAARNVFAPLQDPVLFGPAAEHVHYTSGAPTGSILGRTVHVLGASDAKAEKVLRGLTCAGAYVDEVTVIPEPFFVQLLNRLWNDAALFGTTNPDNPAHWLKRRYLDRLGQLPDWRYWHFVLDDNPALTDQRKAAIRRENVGLYYRRFVLGEWVAAEGAIYPMWDPARHVIPFDALPPMARLLACGVDYGTTNATAGLLLGVTAEAPRLVLCDEWRHDPSTAAAGNRLTDAQLSAGLRGWLAEQPPVEWVAVDPAAASFKVQLHADGVRNVIDADNDVAYGIRTVASLLGTGQLLVADRCTGFVSEVAGYAWDPKATERGEDKPIKVADHSLDAGRYAVATTEALWRGQLAEPVLEAV